MRKIYTLFLLFTFAFSAFGNAKLHETNEDGFFSLSGTAQSDLNIFPNPVKNFATIEYSSNVDKIVIMNIVGKEVRVITPEMDNAEVKVNLTDLQPGVYFIAAYSNGAKLITKRFMKEQ